MSDEAALREVNRTIIEMARAIGALESTVKTLTTTWQTQEVIASEGRRDLHKKFDGLAGKVSELAGKLDIAVKDLGEIKPSVEAFEVAKLQAIGGLKLGKLIWMALPFSVAAAWSPG
jgi:hypothetical protein